MAEIPESRVFSVHQYDLGPDISDDEFVSAVEEAESRGCFEITGLIDYRFGRGIRGSRKEKFALLWVWEDFDAWEDIWGPVEDPVPKSEYPDPWLVWEDDILDPLLSEDPDRIAYTTYLELEIE